MLNRSFSFSAVCSKVRFISLQISIIPCSIPRAIPSSMPFLYSLARIFLISSSSLYSKIDTAITSALCADRKSARMPSLMHSVTARSTASSIRMLFAYFLTRSTYWLYSFNVLHFSIKSLLWPKLMFSMSTFSSSSGSAVSFSKASDRHRICLSGCSPVPL